MRTFLFLQDKKWYEDVGHFFIGFVPFLGWWREQDQWPPGDTKYVSHGSGASWSKAWDSVHYDMHAKPHAPHDRVADSYRDFLGYACGDVARTLITIGVIIWLAVR